jgi:hypothetical protein
MKVDIQRLGEGMICSPAEPLNINPHQPLSTSSTPLSTFINFINPSIHLFSFFRGSNF